jgi:hypothetical protein
MRMYPDVPSSPSGYRVGSCSQGNSSWERPTSYAREVA